MLEQVDSRRSEWWVVDSQFASDEDEAVGTREVGGG